MLDVTSIINDFKISSLQENSNIVKFSEGDLIEVTPNFTYDDEEEEFNHVVIAGSGYNNNSKTMHIVDVIYSDESGYPLMDGDVFPMKTIEFIRNVSN